VKKGRKYSIINVIKEAIDLDPRILLVKPCNLQAIKGSGGSAMSFYTGTSKSF